MQVLGSWASNGYGAPTSEAPSTRESAYHAPMRVIDHIERLDPERDHEEIVRLDYVYEFPWDMTKALELALFRTYAIPSIGGLLDATGEFEHRTQKRYDDTSILIGEFYQHGYREGRGRQAIRRMNQIHGRFRISNDDYLYVLSTFVCEPKRWLERFGWRAFHPHEIEASVWFWRRVGELMGIRGIPESYAEIDAFNRDYERTHFRFSEQSRRVGIKTRDLFMSWYLPRSLWPLGHRAVYALLDPLVLDAFGFPHPSTALRRMVEGALRARAQVMRWLPHGDPKPSLIEDRLWRSYPDGYEIERVGADPSEHIDSRHLKGQPKR